LRFSPISFRLPILEISDDLNETSFGFQVQSSKLFTVHGILFTVLMETHMQHALGFIGQWYEIPSAVVKALQAKGGR
jgi:hypothetical protein